MVWSCSLLLGVGGFLAGPGASGPRSGQEVCQECSQAADGSIMGAKRSAARSRGPGGARAGAGKAPASGGRPGDYPAGARCLRSKQFEFRLAAAQRSVPVAQ